MSFVQERLEQKRKEAEKLIICYPELARAALNAKEQDSAMFWLLARNAAPHGHIHARSLVQYMKQYKFMTKATCYRYIKRANGLFLSTSLSKNGETILHLFSLESVCRRYGLRGVTFPQGKDRRYLRKLSERRAFLYSVAMAYPKESDMPIVKIPKAKPVSRLVLESITSVKRRTQQRNDSRTGMYVDFNMIPDTTHQDFTFFSDVQWQLPNTYRNGNVHAYWLTSRAQRLTAKLQKTLRKIPSARMFVPYQKRYFDNAKEFMEARKKFPISAVAYMWDSEVTGRRDVWQCYSVVQNV